MVQLNMVIILNVKRTEIGFLLMVIVVFCYRVIPLDYVKAKLFKNKYQDKTLEMDQKQ